MDIVVCMQAAFLFTVVILGIIGAARHNRMKAEEKEKLQKPPEAEQMDPFLTGYTAHEAYFIREDMAGRLDPPLDGRKKK